MIYKDTLFTERKHKILYESCRTGFITIYLLVLECKFYSFSISSFENPVDSHLSFRMLILSEQQNKTPKDAIDDPNFQLNQY